MTETVIFLATVLCAASAVAPSATFHANGLPNVGLNATEQIKYHGYPLEVHDVTTEDGYILQLHRIPRGLRRATVEGRPVALFIPGLFCTSGVLIINGPGKSLPLILADMGYDVWIGNQRGSTYSRRHLTLDPWTNRRKYWNFSNHEIGVYDMPAFVDYVLGSTGKDELVFVGHSHGTTLFFIFASERPEYNKKIRLSVMLAPVTYTSKIFNPIGRILGDLLDVDRAVLNALGIYAIFVESEIYTTLGHTVCGSPSPLVELCANVLFLISGYDSEQFNRTLMPLISSVAPAGASVKSAVHYGQNYKSGFFRQFDYGRAGNLRQYGHVSPPNYNMSKVSAPVGIYYGANDWLASVKDVDQLARELPNLVDYYLVPYDKWNHMDFIWATDIYELLYEQILTTLMRY